jgi:formylglycine-generating enzyme required for sulfatase activity
MAPDEHGQVNKGPDLTGPGLTATEFKPLDGPGGTRTSAFSLARMILAVVVLVAAAVLLYLFAARAVIFLPDPVNAELEVSGISFNIGDNFLLLRGDHTVKARAEGYLPFEETVLISDQATQEIDIVLEPLPGKLDLASELDGIEVSIDDEVVGTAPGLIENISRGKHIIGFSKHRYFPARQEIDIEGLGRVQSLEVVLDPAWGQMEFITVPDGAELSIDGQPAGQTPMTTEVLETGTQVSIAVRGYKTWQKELSVKAGTTVSHPLIELTVADGTLDISSSPRGANVTINREFRGITPLSVDLSPLREHQVEFFLEGYSKAVRRVSIEPEQTSKLSLNLAPIIGHIRLSVDPADAEVIVDGTAKGTGSQTLALTAREHDISVRKPGYETHEVKITPRPDHEQALDIKLLTVQQAYWATRPPQIRSPVGSRMKLFRPDVSFKLGAPRREPGRRANEAERNVALQRPFYIGLYEISNAEFRLWKEEHSSKSIQAQSLDMDKQPVAHVGWQEAALYCNWLSRREGLPVFYREENGLVTGFILDSHGYRLPTEAEWAYVAKIDADGGSMMFPWGNDLYPPPDVAANYADQSAARFLSFILSNYNDGFAVSAPVDSFEPNHHGIYNMSGNVAEWINDYFDIRPSGGEPELDPSGPGGGNRHVIRGSSWAMGSRSELRLSYRDAGNDGRMDVGFRLARYVDKAGISE